MIAALPNDLETVIEHDPRFVDVDQALRELDGSEELWWRGLCDTANCHDPEEIAGAMREKGLADASAEPGIVWLRRVEPSEAEE